MRRWIIAVLVGGYLATAAQAAAVTHGVTLTSSGNQATYTTASFTPTSGDLLVAMTFVSATVDAGAMTDSLGGGWTQIVSEAFGTGMRWIFIRDTLSDGSALTVAMDVTGDNGTGAVIFVARVSGMTKTGITASRQTATNAFAASGTPAATFSAAALTENPTLGVIVNTTNPATVTPPTNWTEDAAGDTGYTVPTIGSEYVYRNSGFTGTTITWGSTSATAGEVFTIELDTSTASMRRVIVIDGD